MSVDQMRVSSSSEHFTIWILFCSSRVSIIRGRVVTMNGQGIIGVRVSVARTKDSTNYGFTLTRPGGW